ncbi:MAG: hypothetical protein EOO01_30880 [Chitinophagaceae bacterium]|nr:MAG: hypothetical protein EOO01_30880 [Chitinophagaceae bacterium]
MLEINPASRRFASMTNPEKFLSNELVKLRLSIYDQERKIQLMRSKFENQLSRELDKLATLRQLAKVVESKA